MNISQLHQLLKEADLDFNFFYKTNSKLFENRCRVRLYRPADRQIIILTELACSGASVTNSIEYIIPQLEMFLLREKGVVNMCDCTYIEHYDFNSYFGDFPPDYKETFDKVTLLDSRPGWCRLSVDDVFLLLTSS